MESLLENPVRAVLYLKELTAIVQNQQSLIHTQRRRIDELERRLDELSHENRSLRQQYALPEPAQQQQQQPPHGPPAAPPPPPPPPQQEPLQHPQQLPAPQPPPPPPSKPPQAGPSGSSGSRPAHQHPPLAPHQHPPEKDGREKSCCLALLQHKPPQAIAKGVLSRRPDHAFFVEAGGLQEELRMLSFGMANAVHFVAKLPKQDDTFRYIDRALVLQCHYTAIVGEVLAEFWAFLIHNIVELVCLD
uniref:Uncharacterized protein n=1 Tax=Sphaerodactylus townsendi TaxID=933632 RepID=A0ACB8FM53_9SAUR